MRLGFIYSNSPLSFLIFVWKDYYIIYNHHLLYVIGLVFSHSLASYGITTVIIWYFTDYTEELAMAAILSNIQGSISSFLVIFMAHAADSFVGRFQTLYFSTTAYICGLMLLWMFNPHNVIWLVVVALVLLSLGTSGTYVLQAIFFDLVNNIDKSQDQSKTRSNARANIWWRITYVCGAISATVWVGPDALFVVYPTWRISFLICIIPMTTALAIFCIGHKVYHQDEMTERPFVIFFQVFRACKSWCLMNTSRQDRSPQNLDTEKSKNERIMKEISLQSSDTTGCSSCQEEDMMVVKSLLKMFPMWGMFLVVSMISATGSTFFLLQYSNLNANNKISVQIYSLVQDSSSFLIPFLYSSICSRCWLRGFHKNDKVKIGVGMLFAIISCVLAWKLEMHRLKEVKRLEDQDANTSISFLWLMPQFCMLGCMEGLTDEGLLNLCKSQIWLMPHNSTRSYGEEYIEIVHGFGKLLNVLLILFGKSQLGWFGYTINESHVDKYYRVLINVCSANFIFYCFIAKFFYKNAEQNQDFDDYDSQQDDGEEP